MKRTNRRDYLKQVSAGVGIIAGASELDLFAQRSNRNSKSQRTLSPEAGALNGILNWPITNTPPSAAPVTAIFSGLLGFSYDKTSSECKVGFHPGEGHHKLD